jgi:copper chaperone NosL
MKRLFLIIVAGLLLVGVLEGAPLLWAQGVKAIKPGPKDKCPVCGMFVAKYPDFVAVLGFKDGTPAFFDGVKDMMRYYFNLEKYNPSKKREDLAQIHVTDYYTLGFVDGFKAFYVSGSDIHGPMGKELIPFQKEGDAKEFLKDHKGKAVLQFQDISADVVKRLD